MVKHTFHMLFWPLSILLWKVNTRKENGFMLPFVSHFSLLIAKNK